MSAATGYGKTAQDWSYLTPKRAIAVQTGNVTNPSLLGDEFIIDTTKDSQGKNNSRARNQTLVIFAVPKAGVALAADATLHLWSKIDWDEKCENSEQSSSSVCPDLGVTEALDAPDRWALIEAAKHSDAVTSGFASSLCFSFPWLPAGVYKAAIADGITGSNEVIIVEQHTE